MSDEETKKSASTGQGGDTEKEENKPDESADRRRARHRHESARGEQAGALELLRAAR